MDKVLYHQHGLPPKLFSVLKRNKDSTVDIGEDSIVKVAGCHITKEPRSGAATLPIVPESPEDAVKKLRAIAHKLAGSAEKAKAAAAAKPDDAKLAETAVAAEAAAKKADAEAAAAEEALKQS